MEANMEAIRKLYSKMDMDEDLIQDNMENDLLSECTARNGRTVWWYLDNANCGAIYEDTLEFLTMEEIENELC